MSWLEHKFLFSKKNILRCARSNEHHLVSAYKPTLVAQTKLQTVVNALAAASQTPAEVVADGAAQRRISQQEIFKQEDTKMCVFQRPSSGFRVT